ncbi:MAG: tryptophan 2,3-dioxygenase [Blastocatellia bacterium]|nr:tryptophan 2,3-dioxygenase [Blastocatellia bacterium]MBL8196287.1 tryptophan 2,3-dioxygenase [Blastocatellia bacterium]MBN8722390.1 tryptophan 2,3-dioxygenase [Acidobacteriota bacterium]
MPGYFGANIDGIKPLNYDEYLKVPQLINLQECRSTPAHHDEMLFIIIHQTYELWFRLILHECDSAMMAMKNDDLFLAERQLGRVVEINRILVPQIHILETMLPVDFLAFRDHLKPASGFQSAQFREVEFSCGLKDERILGAFADQPEALERLKQRLNSPTLADAFYQLLARRGFDVTVPPPRSENEIWNNWQEKVVKELLKVYLTPSQHYDIYRLAERLVEVDEYTNLWRFHHLRMVERMIGNKFGTGGSEGIGYLQRTLGNKFFPELWQVRTHLEKFNNS